jgi:hypothetical protein
MSKIGLELDPSITKDICLAYCPIAEHCSQAKPRHGQEGLAAILINRTQLPADQYLQAFDTPCNGHALVSVLQTNIARIEKLIR